MRVTVVAHASVLVEVGGARVLVDPIFSDTFGSDTLRFQPRRRLDVAALVESTTAIVVTHVHLDHFHPPSLERFPRHVPILVPPHEALKRVLDEMGFTRVISLAPWDAYELAGGRLLATPSEFEVAELGIVAIEGAGAGSSTYWHMSDAIVTAEVGCAVREHCGAISLLSVKHQPLRTLIGYQRGLQAMMLDRDELVATFEAACAAEPGFVFPYYGGFAFDGEHAWANRHIAPFSGEEIARLFRARLGGDVPVETVEPGDVFEIDQRKITKHSRASAWVEPLAGAPPEPWEPIDPSTLTGLSSTAERVFLAVALRKLLVSEVLPFVQEHLHARSGLFDAYHELQAVWQATIHAGEGVRLHHALDFRGSEPQLHLDCIHPHANVFVHHSGLELLRVIEGHAGPEVFWMAGAYRIYEKLLFVEGGCFRHPPENGWDLYERLPDPVSHYLRKTARRRE